MNRLKRVFANGMAFIPFITAGDPALEVTEELTLGLAEAGADLIELGIPFSDPVAEGPVIQEADRRALTKGVTTDKIFALVERVRRRSQAPLALMTYVNPVFTYGTRRFMKNCQEVGVDAVIVPDTPYEERDELAPFCSEHGVRLISMIAPTSKNRIQMIAREAQGFVYCVSSMGVTGTRQEIGSEAEEMIKEVKKVNDIPCAIGFGVSTPEQAKGMAKFADGVIVGSAIVKIIAEHGMDCLPHVLDFARLMNEAIKGDSNINRRFYQGRTV